jgi:hypothetical protein
MASGTDHAKASAQRLDLAAPNDVRALMATQAFAEP